MTPAKKPDIPLRHGENAMNEFIFLFFILVVSVITSDHRDKIAQLSRSHAELRQKIDELEARNPGRVSECRVVTKEVN